MADLIDGKKSSLNNEMMNKFHKTLYSMTQMKKTAESGKSYDQIDAERRRYSWEPIGSKSCRQPQRSNSNYREINSGTRS